MVDVLDFGEFGVGDDVVGGVVRVGGEDDWGVMGDFFSDFVLRMGMLVLGNGG